MKKGCFLTAITLITILVMIGIYLFKTNKDFFSSFSKEKVLELAQTEIEEKIGEIKTSPYKDSLNAIVKKEINIVKDLEFKKAVKKFGLVSERIKELISDGKIDSTEFAEIKKLVKSDERSEKNGN